MDIKSIVCPGGRDSQSGNAALGRYTDCQVEPCNGIPEVDQLLNTNPGPYLIPIWNSHEGEVPKAKFIWDRIKEFKVKVVDVFPKKIEFWYLKRIKTTTKYNKIGSVGVARTQCSGFLSKHGAELEPRGLTTDAYKEYLEGAPWDGVLVAPGLGENEPGYEVSDKKTANPNNFTSFVTLVTPSAFPIPGMNIRSFISGVSMPSFSGSTLDETVQSFFEKMLDSVSDLSDIPMPIFVFDRNATVGLLFEGKPLRAGDLLDAEEQERENVLVYEDVGGIEKQYAQEIETLCKDEFHELCSADFIFHSGVTTCLFACPPLGLYTHGYKAEAVERVVRFFIHKLFELWDEDNLGCTPLQTQFFEKHKTVWQEKGSEFIKFEIINPT